MTPPTPLRFECPRCHTNVEQPYYGPCAGCREQLSQITPPDPDPVHFVNTKRMDGAHAITVTTCNDDTCERKACVQARDDQLAQNQPETV